MDFIRHGEENIHPFRSGRFCNENGQWFFHTREGVLNGPFKDRSEALRGLAIFLARAVHELPEQQRRNTRHDAGAQDNVQPLVHEMLGFLQSRSKGGDLAALSWASQRITQLRSDRKIDRREERIDILNHAINHD